MRAKLPRSNPSRGQEKTKIPVIRQRKHSPGVLAVPLARHDEIHCTDRVDDKWQGEESVNEKCCVFGSGGCALVFLFLFLFFSSERVKKVTSERAFYFLFNQARGKKKNSGAEASSFVLLYFGN